MGHFPQFFRCDGLDRLQHRIQRFHAAVHEKSLRQPRQHVAAMFVAECNLAQQPLFRFMKLPHAQLGVAHLVHLPAHEVGHTLVKPDIRAVVHVEHPHILVHHVVGFNVVHHPMLLTDVQVQTAIHRRAAEHVGHHGHRELVFVVASRDHAPHHMVHLLDVATLLHAKSSCALRGRHPDRGRMCVASSHFGKMSFRPRQGLRPCHIAHHPQDHVGWSVPCVDKTAHLVPGEGLDVARGAQDGTPQGVIPKQVAVKRLKDDIAWGVVHAGNFIEHHVPLLVQLALRKHTAKGDVGQQLEGALRVLVPL